MLLMLLLLLIKKLKKSWVSDLGMPRKTSV
jgi:hypothetical protein